MAGSVHPPDAPRPTDSEAEKTVWKALKARLPNGWTAWHSLRIRDKHAYLGEGDFVLAHPSRGLLVIEVKGGRIELRDGRWYSNSIALEKAPLTQGLGFTKMLVRRLEEWDCRPPAWGTAVAFPETDFDQQPHADDVRGVVIGSSQLAWLEKAFAGVVERAMPAPGAGRGNWVGRLHELWGRSWVPALSLGTLVRRAHESRLALDDTQLIVLDGLADEARVLVSGGAGTGKTLIAVEAARRVAAAGKKVLLLCFTQPLRKWLATLLDSTGVQVETVSGFAKQIAEATDGSWGARDLTDSELWRRYYERAADLATPRWDAVIVDEAQDLLYEAWFFVRALAEGKRLWAFYDPGQGYWTDREPPRDLFGSTFKLTRGKRSPEGILALANRYLGQPVDDAPIRAAVRDRILARVACDDPKKVGERVGAEVDRLVNEGIPLRDIGVVSLRGQTAAGAVHRLERVGRHPFVHADDDGMEDRLVADSFLRWKGLERPVIVVADVDPATSRFGTRMHIALTRALSAVRIVAPVVGDEWPGLPKIEILSPQ